MTTLPKLISAFMDHQRKLDLMRDAIVQQLNGPPSVALPRRDARKLTNGSTVTLKRRTLSKATRLKMSQGAKKRWALRRAAEKSK